VNWKPKKWIAVVLGLFNLPLAMLYVVRPLWAVIYVGAALLIGLANVFVFHLSSAASGVVLTAIVLVGTCHAYRLATKYGAAKPRAWYSHWYGLAAVGAFLVLVFGRKLPRQVDSSEVEVVFDSISARKTAGGCLPSASWGLSSL